MFQYSQEHFDDFKAIAGLDLSESFGRFLTFIDRDYQSIIDYYSGNIDKPISSAFKNLENLQTEFRRIVESFVINKHSFNGTVYWEMLDHAEEIITRLQTVENSPKWLRSAISKNCFNPDIEVEYIMRQRQTLEDVAKNVAGSSSPDDDWQDIAFRNDLTEEEYTPAGGTKINISFKNGALFSIQSVVDTISGLKVYGRDLDRKITFEGDDLKVLSEKETIFQTVDILSKLKRGDNMEFPEDGLNEKFIVGTNLASIQFPSIFRQMSLVFSKDDSLKNFKLIDIKQSEGGIWLQFQVETRLDEIMTKNLTI
jgi:hypothetical protein